MGPIVVLGLHACHTYNMAYTATATSMHMHVRPLLGTNLSATPTNKPNTIKPNFIINYSTPTHYDTHHHHPVFISLKLFVNSTPQNFWQEKENPPQAQISINKKATSTLTDIIYDQICWIDQQ